MAGEGYAFADAFDAAYIVNHDLERIYRQHLPLIMLTDSKQMYDVVTRASQTTKKRLVVDVAAAREAYKRNEISHVCHLTDGQRHSLRAAVDHPFPGVD